MRFALGWRIKTELGLVFMDLNIRTPTFSSNEWGFDFIKIDYCGAGQQLDLEEQERYTEIVNAIREVCPRNISLNICRVAYPVHG